MSEIINLRQARKAKQRAEAKVNAAANRAQFGRTKGEKRKQEMDARRIERELDGAKRDDGGAAD